MDPAPAAGKALRGWAEAGPAWSVAAARRRIGLGNVDAQHAPKELGAVHIVDRVGRISPLVILQKGKSPVLL